MREHFPLGDDLETKLDENSRKGKTPRGEKIHTSLGRAAVGQARKSRRDINDNKAQWLGWATKDRVGEPFISD